MIPSLLLAAVCTLQFDVARAYEAPPESHVARDAEVADLDGDGNPDVVVDDRFAYIRYGQRGGRLGERVELPVSEATAVDVDRDRLPDLIVRYDTAAGPRIGVMRNLGNRTFAPAREVFGGGGMMIAGDFTNDGAPDVLIVRDGREQPAFLLNDGRGNFELKWGAAPALIDVRAIVTGDFNGDGNLDLAAWHGFPVVLQLFHGEGTGYLPAGPELAGARKPLAAADFDGDGRDELLSTGSSSTTVTVWEGTEGTDVKVSADVVNAIATTGDFNGDGAPDAALSTDYAVLVLLNDGRGTLTERGWFRTATPAPAFAAGDFDSDGDDDLLVPSGYGIAIVRSNGDGTFRALPRVPAMHGQPADVDGDGVDEQIDVIDGRLVIVRGGSVAERVSVRTASAWSIVTWHAPSRRVLAMRDRVLELFVRDPNGEWRLERTHDVDPASATLGDFDGDGVLEIAFVSRGAASRLVVLSPSGSTRFETAIGGGYHLTAADMNGDGRDDLAVTFGGSFPSIPHVFEPVPDGWIDVYLSAGTSFLPPARVVAGQALVAPQRGDFDGDGKDDLAVATYATEMLVVWGRTMTATVVIDEMVDWYAMELAVGDLNDDGFDDLVATHVELDLHVLTGSATGLVNQGPFLQPTWYTKPAIARLETGKPRAIVLRDLTDAAAGDFLLQPTCAYPRRRGVRN